MRGEGGGGQISILKVIGWGTSFFSPVATASIERSVSQMKMIKTRLRNRMGQMSLSHRMKISIESPEKLSDSDLENIVDVWNKNNIEEW